MIDLKEIKDPVTEKISFARTSTGDLEICEGIEETAARVDDEIKLILGEYPLDKGRGIPLFSGVFRREKYKNLVLGYFRAAIMRVKGIQGIKSITLEYKENHQAELNYSAFYQNGETIEGTN